MSKLLAYVTCRWISSSFIGASPRSNNKAAGSGANRRLCVVPLRTVFLDGIIGLSKPGSEVCRGLHMRPTLPLKEKRNAPIRPRKPTTPRRSSPLFIEHNASLAHAPKNESVIFRFVPKADLQPRVARTRRVEAHHQRRMTEAKSVSLRAWLSRASILRCGCLDRT
jgi:hypothetical protein